MAESSIVLLKNTLYKKITATEDVLKLRQCLEKCHRSELLSWSDTDHYDILHHAIIADNEEAVEMLFALGHFKTPHEPKYHSYIHLAANFGNRAIAVMLLQERPRDYTVQKTKFKYAKKPTEIPFASQDGCSMVSPLDVAANCGYTACVKTILDVSSVKANFQISTDNHLSASCASNSPSALRLLLKQSSEKDVNAAVGTALKLANAECLDVLLSCHPNLTSVFSGMNLYHVLYSYSLSFNTEWYESLLTVTSVLLKHKQHPMSTVPFRTYPLYSLLSLAPSSDYGKTLPYIVACMLLLLNANVDPNFNEVAFEEKHSGANIQTAFGRSAFPSALHCLYGNARNLLKLLDDDVKYIRHFVNKATETLLNHSADLSICGPIDGTDFVGNPLMAFLKILIRQGLDEKCMNTFRLLSQNGSDLNISSEGRYLINIFMDEMLLNSDAFNAIHTHHKNTFVTLVNEVVETLLGNMTQTSLVLAGKVEYDGKPTSELQKRGFKICKSEILKRSRQVLSLKAQCRLCLLMACNWKPTRVIELPLPLSMKKYLNGVV